MEFKELKREILIELIDVLDDNQAGEYLHTDDILKASIITVQKNIFRTF